MRTTLILAAVAACAVAVNSAVAAVALGNGASADFQPLKLPVYAAFTVVGVVVGWFGWRFVQRRAERPRAVLMYLVPAATLVSFAPDLALLALRFIPGTSSTAVAALAAMHVVVVALAVPGYAFASPLPAAPLLASPQRG
jgi:hypothetical protein